MTPYTKASSPIRMCEGNQINELRNCFIDYIPLILLFEGTSRNWSKTSYNFCQCIRYYEKSELYRPVESSNGQHNWMLGYFYWSSKSKGLTLKFLRERDVCNDSDPSASLRDKLQCSAILRVIFFHVSSWDFPLPFMTAAFTCNYALLWRTQLCISINHPVGAGVRCPQSYLCSRQNQLWSHCHFPQANAPAHLLFDSLPWICSSLSVSFLGVLESPKWIAILQIWSKTSLRKGSNSFLGFLVAILCTQKRMLLVLVIARAYNWLILSSLPARAPKLLPL